MNEPTQREKARAIIAPIVLAMAGKSRREIRKELRAVRHQFYLYLRTRYGVKVWQQEVAFALRDRSRKFTRRTKVFRPEEIMPAQREWAAAQGLLAPLAVLDVDDHIAPDTIDSSNFELQ